MRQDSTLPFMLHKTADVNNHVASAWGHGCSLAKSSPWVFVAVFTKGDLSPCQASNCRQYCVNTHANCFILEYEKVSLANDNSGCIRPSHGEVVTKLAH